MSRQQRRIDRKGQSRGAAPTVSRRTPVRASAGRQVPWIPIGIAAGVIAVVALIAYLILQSGGGADVATAQKAADDQSSSIPGTYVPNPHGSDRPHLPGSYTPDRTPIAFCPGVPRSASADIASGLTPAATTGAEANATPQPAATPAASETNGTPSETPTGVPDCRNSNPPATGAHLNVQHNVDVGNGAVINIPPDPDVYPSDVQIPRDAIPHILEHAGVFVGYHCVDGDDACQRVVDDLTKLVNDRIDNNKNRVVMANDSDLPEGWIGLSSWSRVEDFTYQDYTRDRASKFISTNSCRVDFEGFCK